MSKSFLNWYFWDNYRIFQEINTKNPDLMLTRRQKEILTFDFDRSMTWKILIQRTSLWISVWWRRNVRTGVNYYRVSEWKIYCAYLNEKLKNSCNLKEIYNFLDNYKWNTFVVDKLLRPCEKIILTMNFELITISINLYQPSFNFVVTLFEGIKCSFAPEITFT